uniref:Uncharacterized protein n=1 Tax=Oryza meridionalis TaxID=40149 RepID=A0A0E0EZR5_9ORYZ
MEETAAIRTSGIPVSVSSTASADGDASADPTASAAAAASTVGDDEHDSKEVVLRRYFLQEWEIVSDILRRIIDAGGVAEPADVQRIRSIMDKYQEEGQLLEPYLESIISPLMLLVRSKTMELGACTDELLDIIKPLCIIIYTLVTVCGYKSIIKFFPHQVSDLEPAVALLEECHKMSSATALRQESTGEMETKCVVLLWLYILVLIPFDISSVDTSIATADHVDGPETVPLVTRILDICKDYLCSSGPMRRMSGLLLARLLTRPDMPKVFSSFMEWAQRILLSVTDDFVDQFRSIGIVEALASIFKIGNRKVLCDAVSGIWNDCSVVMKTNIASRSSLLRKFLVKLAQRVALISLPPRSPSWRYQSISSSLGANLSTSTDGTGTSSGSTKQVNIDQTDTSSLEEDMDVPEIVEEIIDLLLTGLRDSDTIVRWSAAKGVGRITARLTPALSEEVLSSILQLFSPGEGDGSWHGGCLALAELARRGLLLPSSFPDVIPVIIKALHYDVRRGPHSIGSHVNCRRAASAAFQENVGRQGNFPHGIDIVNAADYFALASRSNSYLNVAVFVAQYKEYLHPFAEELLCNKISHWERSLRELAAQALSMLVQYDMNYFAGYALEKLVPCTLSSDLCTRHGATLAAGEIALKLYQLGFTFTTDMQKALSGIVPAIEKARLYRGKGGEIMRSAVSRFIACISMSGISLNEKTKRSLLETLNENLRHPNAQIQCAAVDALKHFIPTYLVSSGEKTANDIITKYLTLLDDPNVAARRGAALALGTLPYEFLVLKWMPVISKLCNSCTIEDKPDDPDAEARVNSVRGLILVCETLTASVEHSSSFGDSMYSYIKDKVMQALFRALDDYAVDNRGDVGSWVREAAMDALERCTSILCKRDNIAVKITPVAEHESKSIDIDTNAVNTRCQLFDSSIAQDLVAGIAKQAVEKIDKIREIAAKTLKRILYNQELFVPSIPYRELLEQIIPNSADLEWAGHSEFYSGLIKSLGPVLKGSKDFAKLSAGLSILGYISSQSDGSGSTAFSQLLTFLGHRYPKIRKAAADQVYLVLLQNDSLIAAENIDKAQEVIAETCWEGDVEEARRKRSELNEMAGFGAATPQKPGNEETRRKTDVRNAASTDENKSYSSLVDFSGY